MFKIHFYLMFTISITFEQTHHKSKERSALLFTRIFTIFELIVPTPNLKPIQEKQYGMVLIFGMRVDSTTYYIMPDLPLDNNIIASVEKKNQRTCNNKTADTSLAQKKRQHSFIRLLLSTTSTTIDTSPSFDRSVDRGSWGGLLVII